MLGKDRLEMYMQTLEAILLKLLTDEYKGIFSSYFIFCLNNNFKRTLVVYYNFKQDRIIHVSNGMVYEQVANSSNLKII